MAAGKINYPVCLQKDRYQGFKEMLHSRQETTSRFGIAHFERRRHPRFSVLGPLEYWPINQSQSLSARMGDVSEGGLLLYISDTVEVGQKLKLKLFIGALLSLKPIEATGEVLWKDFHFGEKDEYRMGVKFVEISPVARGELKTFLETPMKLKSPPGSRIPSNLLFDLGLSTEIFQGLSAKN